VLVLAQQGCICSAYCKRTLHFLRLPGCLSREAEGHYPTLTPRDHLGGELVLSRGVVRWGCFELKSSSVQNRPSASRDLFQHSESFQLSDACLTSSSFAPRLCRPHLLYLQAFLAICTHWTSSPRCGLFSLAMKTASDLWPDLIMASRRLEENSSFMGGSAEPVRGGVVVSGTRGNVETKGTQNLRS
jgi:hypothetical protein